MRTLIAMLVGLAMVGSGSGCRKSDNRFVPVSGRVTLDGQPLVDAAVSFWSERDEFSGYTDAAGRYQLKPGAVPGTYSVYLRKYDAGQQNNLALDPGAVGRAPPRPAILSRPSS